MYHSQCNLLPSNKLNVHTKEYVFISCGTRYFKIFSSIFSAIIELTLSSICETVLSYTNHLIMHWLSLIWSQNMIMLMRIVYIITGHSLSFRRLTLGFSHIALLDLFICYDFLYSGSTSHIMSTDLPSNFMCITLFLGSDTWIYYPGTSKVCTAIPSWE